MARREAYNLSRRANWAAMVVEWEFIANGSSDYPLPPDFRSFVDDTMWDRTRFWRMRGAMTPQQWQLYKSSVIGRATVERRWRMHIPSGAPDGEAVVFSIDPALGATDTSSQFVFEYVSKNWCRSATTYSIDELTVDPSVLLTGGGNLLTGGGNLLMSTYWGGTGFAVGDQFSIVGGTSTVAATGVVTALDPTTGTGILTAAVVDPGIYTVLPASPAAMVATTGSGSGARFTINSTSAPGHTQSDWIADTDTAILDEDLIEMGVIWRLMRRLGIAYDEELNEYEVQVRQAIARDGGTQILNLAPYDKLTLVGPWNLQEGNFPG